MKRSKLMAGVLTMSLALMGTGYAYWADALTVQGTVSTGQLDMNFVTDPAGYVDGMKYVEPAGDTDMKSIDDVDDVLTYTMDDLYPGANYLLDYAFQNDGTMATKINGINIEVVEVNSVDGKEKVTQEELEAFKKNLFISGELVVLNEDGSIKNKLIDINSEDSISIEKFNNKVKELFEEQAFQHHIKPGEKVTFKALKVEMSKKVGVDDAGVNELANKVIGVNIETTFTQWNDMTLEQSFEGASEKTGLRMVTTTVGDVTKTARCQVYVTGDMETITVAGNTLLGTVAFEKSSDGSYKVIQCTEDPDMKDKIFTLDDMTLTGGGVSIQIGKMQETK